MERKALGGDAAICRLTGEPSCKVEARIGQKNGNLGKLARAN